MEHTWLKKYGSSYPYEFPDIGGGEKQEEVVLLDKMGWSWHTLFSHNRKLERILCTRR